MASNEDTAASGLSSDSGDEFSAPPNKVRRISFSGRVESEVVASSSFENELTQNRVESDVVASRSFENELTQNRVESDVVASSSFENELTQNKIESEVIESRSFENELTQGESGCENVNTIENESYETLYSREADVTITGDSEISNVKAREELKAEGDDNIEEKSVEQTGDEGLNDITPPPSIEVHESFWRNKTLCAMLWRESVATPEPEAKTSDAVEGNSDAVEEKAERKPSLICLQLSTSASATPASYPLCVNQNFRSDQVRWDLKAFDSQRKELDWEIFKGVDSSRIEKKQYAELFPSKASEITTPNGTAEDCYRENSPAVLQVEIKRRTYREAAIEWTAPSAVDKWLVLIRNDGRQPSNSSDHNQTADWMIIFRSQPSRLTYRIDNDLVKLEYQAGHMYAVRVIGLQRKYNDLPNDDVECYAVIAFSDKSFRAENTEEDYRLLLSRARGVRQHPDQSNRPCQYLYRDKTNEHFNALKANSNNVMEVYLKDANGDPAAPIHGRLKGLFFSANVNFRTGGPMSPRFGNRRVLIPPEKLLAEDTNMYFGDFYCLNEAHLVTLVVTRSNSEADEFCREKKLPLLGRTKDGNPFLYFSGGGSVYVSSQITVEVFYTENIDLKDLELPSRYNGKWVRFECCVNNRHGDKWKKSYCPRCNLYSERIPGAFLV